MCRAALLSLIHAGHQAVALVEPTLAQDDQLRGYGQHELELYLSFPCEQPHMRLRDAYAACDRTIVIAPESDGILAATLQSFCDQRLATCNCVGEFLQQATDKWLCARQLQASHIPTPPTQKLSEAPPEWLADIDRQRSTSGGEPLLWAIKSRDGAGCDGLRRLTAAEVQFLRTQGSPPAELERWVIQPWCPGTAYSRAAVIDRDGQATWLPVTAQHLELSERVRYSGGQVLPRMAEQLPQLDLLLQRAIQALGPSPLGWVGVDFVVDHSRPEQPIWIIEINPRLTTSFVGLAAAGAPDLAAWIVAAAGGQFSARSTTWSPVAFSANGTTDPHVNGLD